MKFSYGISRTAPTKESAVLGRGKQYGTPLWMAPEIIRKDLYTKAADVYRQVAVTNMTNG